MTQRTTHAPLPLALPTGLTHRRQAYPTVFVDTADLDLQGAGPEDLGRINEALAEALRLACSRPPEGQGLLKVHIGEPKCATRMRPHFAAGAARYAQDGGASIVAGDTTVAYTGQRGHKDNPPGNVRKYMQLAERHGWSRAGPAGMAFVVLDRPSTALPGVFHFEEQQQRIEVARIQRFRDFYLAGGFAAADFVINYAHLTLHGLAGVAGCVKSIAMGCSSLPGKLRMHQSLLPHFDARRCAACGRCVDNCPEGALTLPDTSPTPIVDAEACIGCGECEAVCAPGKNAVRLCSEDVGDWQRGEQTLPFRMVDYTLGLMHDRWDTTVHVLHLYSVTRRCDCVDLRQRPMLGRDLGFLVGRNPFAVDALAGQMLADALRDEGRTAESSATAAGENSARYVQSAYGVLTDTRLETIAVG